jgi:hypothetical protein
MRRSAGEWRTRPLMKLWKKLQNPFALVAQGFVLGGLLFLATHSESIAAAPALGSMLSSAQVSP